VAERPSLAEDRFNEIIAMPQMERAARLRRMTDKTDPTFETDWIEFKCKPKEETRIAEIWAKALNGFANSGGGLLVWGIDARKNPVTGIDAASEEEPISNPLAFKARLLELHRCATNPPLANVQIEVADTAPGEGFVACLIPEGRFKPYRAEIAGRPQYHIRAGDQFIVPSPALLRTLFYPQSQVVFHVETMLTWTLGQANEPGWDRARISGKIYLHNQGPATAKDTYIILQTNLHNLNRPQDSDDWLFLEFNPNKMRFQARRPIHPEVTVMLGCLEWQSPTTTAFREQNLVVPQMRNCRLLFHFHVEDQVPQRAEIVFDGEQLRAEGRQYTQTVTATD
jgi:hypothetical protein